MFESIPIYPDPGEREREREREKGRYLLSRIKVLSMRIRSTKKGQGEIEAKKAPFTMSRPPLAFSLENPIHTDVKLV